MRVTDDQLRELVRFLDRTVGKESWVIAITADHGLQPLPETKDAWKIDQALLRANLEANFGDLGIVQEDRPVGFWLHEDRMASAGITFEDVANYVMDYRARDDLEADEEVQPGFEDKLGSRLFDAAFPMTELPRILDCARENG